MVKILANVPCKNRAKKYGVNRISVFAIILATCACTEKPLNPKIKLTIITLGKMESVSMCEII